MSYLPSRAEFSILPDAGQDAPVISTDAPISPERRLALAVIHQAFLDLFETPDGRLAGYEGSPAERAPSAGRIRREAERFLFDTDCQWADARAVISALADLDPDAVRRAAWARLDRATAA